MEDSEDSFPVINGKGESSKMVEIEMKDDEECSEVNTDWNLFVRKFGRLVTPSPSCQQLLAAFAADVFFIKIFSLSFNQFFYKLFRLFWNLLRRLKSQMWMELLKSCSLILPRFISVHIIRGKHRKSAKLPWRHNIKLSFCIFVFLSAKKDSFILEKERKQEKSSQPQL